MTEIKAGEGAINGYAPLMVSDRELKYLYAYLKDTRPKRKKELAKAARKAKHLEKKQATLSGLYKCMQERLETRNHDLDRIADMLEEM